MEEKLGWGSMIAPDMQDWNMKYGRAEKVQLAALPNPHGTSIITTGGGISPSPTDALHVRGNHLFSEEKKKTGRKCA